LLECTKVGTILEFTKQNPKIFKKKLFVFVNAVDVTLCHAPQCTRPPGHGPLAQMTIVYSSDPKTNNQFTENSSLTPNLQLLSPFFLQIEKILSYFAAGTRDYLVLPRPMSWILVATATTT